MFSLLILLCGLVWAVPTSSRGDTGIEAAVSAGASLLDLWVLSGGPTPKADLESVVLVRDQKVMPLDVSPSNKDKLSTIKLVDGDILIVAPGKRVGVTGEVRKPGFFSISSKSKDPVEDALKAAGGTKDTVALSRILLVRPSMRKPALIDWNARDTQGHLKLPMEVEDGDIVWVQPQRCIVLGAVARQGQVMLTGKETLFDVVSASGPSRARLDRVIVIRAADVKSGADKCEAYNLEAAFSESHSLPVVHMEDGDVIFVPSEGQPGDAAESLQRPWDVPRYYDRAIFPFGR